MDKTSFRVRYIYFYTVIVFDKKSFIITNLNKQDYYV